MDFCFQLSNHINNYLYPTKENIITKASILYHCNYLNFYQNLEIILILLHIKQEFVFLFDNECI